MGKSGIKLLFFSIFLKDLSLPQQCMELADCWHCVRPLFIHQSSHHPAPTYLISVPVMLDWISYHWCHLEFRLLCCIFVLAHDPQGQGYRTGCWWHICMHKSMHWSDDMCSSSFRFSQYMFKSFCIRVKLPMQVCLRV